MVGSVIHGLGSQEYTQGWVDRFDVRLLDTVSECRNSQTDVRFFKVVSERGLTGMTEIMSRDLCVDNSFKQVLLAPSIPESKPSIPKPNLRRLHCKA